MASGIPQIQNDYLVFNIHFLRHEVDSDCRLVVVLESLVDEAVDDRSFTGVLVAQEHNLVLKFALGSTLFCIF